jgi:hypothetical protein
MHSWRIETSIMSDAADGVAAILGEDGKIEVSPDNTVYVRVHALNTVDGVANIASAANKLLRSISSVLNASAQITHEIAPVRIHCDRPEHSDAACGGWFAGMRLSYRTVAQVTAREVQEFLQLHGPRLLALQVENVRVTEVLAAFGATAPGWGQLYTVLEAITRDIADRLNASGSEWRPLETMGRFGGATPLAAAPPPTTPPSPPAPRRR